MRPSVATLAVLALTGSIGLHAGEHARPGGSTSRPLNQAKSGTNRDQIPGWFELAVTGGGTTLDALGIPSRERAFTLPIIARALHDRDGRVGMTQPRLTKLLAEVAATPSTGDQVTVPAPLDARIWRQLLPPPDEGDLFARLVVDRNALLVAVGLMATDDSIRSLLSRDRDLLKFIYQNAAGAFAIAARRLRLDGARIAVPGGEHGDAIWRALAGEPPSRAAPFLRALLTKDQGRLAWYFDTIAGLEPSRLAAAWMGATPLEGATELYTSFRDADPQWRVQEQPFRRNVADAWTVVTQNDVVDGALVSSIPRELWELLFSTGRPTVEQVTRLLQGKTTSVKLPWLTRETVDVPVRERRHRLEMFRLAQRVFANAATAELPDVAVALGGIRDFRGLLFTLERMEIRHPATWAAAVEAARHVANESADRKEVDRRFSSDDGDPRAHPPRADDPRR